MKLINQLSFLLITTLLLLNSCSVEKRVYRPGYHVEWKQNYDRSHDTGAETKIAFSSRNQIRAEQASSVMIQLEDFHSSNAVFEENQTTSINTNSVTISSDKSNLIDEKVISVEEIQSSEKESIVNEGNDYLDSNKPKQNDVTNKKKVSVMAVLGFFCGVLGVIIAAVYGFPFFLGTFGIIFSSIGLGATAKDKKSGKGLAIFGLVIGVMLFIFGAIVLSSISINLFAF